MTKMNIVESELITKSYCEGMDYDINPYNGCSHGCIHCYARFMRDVTRHKKPWGKFVDKKLYAAELLPNNTSKYQGKNIFISSLTDPYLPLEKEYQITRKILKKLIPLKPNIWILTKSDLVLRDIDLFKKFENCQIGFTFTTLDEEIRKEIEPNAASTSNRLTALKKLKAEKIKTFVFIGPILPLITNWEKIISKTMKFTDTYMFENLKIHGAIWTSLKKWLENKNKKMLEEYKRIYFTNNNYWNKVEEKIIEFCKDSKLDHRIYFHYEKYPDISNNKK